MSNSFDQFCQKINYQFKDLSLLEEALTHPSLSKENSDKPNYQRLEFLGDKVLSLIVSDFLMKKYPKENEGDLSKRHAALVSGETLSKIALEIGIDKVILLSKGEKKLGGMKNKRNLENALEALVGAIYLDSNYQEANDFVMNFWEERLQKNFTPPKDPISELQEIVQSQTKQLPEYKIEKIGGLDHEPEFLATLTIATVDQEFSAKGKSKKEAQRKAAKEALVKISM